MAHRYIQADVERALVRYHEVTGDRDAALESERVADSAVVVYRVRNSKNLRGFLAYGAYSAYYGIEMYCNGYEDGQTDRAAPAPRKGAKRGS